MYGRIVGKLVRTPSSSEIGINRRHHSCFSNVLFRFYSTKGDGSEGEHVPVEDATNVNKDKCSKHCNEHAQLGEQDQQDWLNTQKMSIESRRSESPSLTKGERFKNEFLRRVVPWNKITVSWKAFPYYINEHTKNLLVECVASHLKQKDLMSAYGARLASSSRRILLRSISGTELYRERLVKALAQDQQASLLVLDNNVLAPYDFGRECASENETDDDNVESGEESTSELDVEDASNEEELASSNESESGESDEDDDVDVQETAESLKKLLPCSIKEFAKSVSEEVESMSASAESNGVESSRSVKKGDRVKYIGDPVHIGVDNRPLSKGQCGVVYEVNGGQVAVILDSAENKTEDGDGDKAAKEEDEKPSIYWIRLQDIVQDLDTRAEDCYLAMEALCEVLPSLQPIIVYFPDSSHWPSRAVPKSRRKEFINKMEEMFDQLPGPVVLICGQNIQEKGSKEKAKRTMVLPSFVRLVKLPLQLKQLTEGLRPSKFSKEDATCKLFANTLHIHPPKEEELLRTFNKQIEDDRRIIISQNNLIELHKVLEEHQLSCMELFLVKTDGVMLTKLSKNIY